MRNKMSDVRDHLVAMLETLGDKDADANAIERAKATALVADKYIAAVKVEIDARRLLSDCGVSLPPVLETPQDAAPSIKLVNGRKA